MPDECDKWESKSLYFWLLNFYFLKSENTKGKTPQSSDCPVTLLKCYKSCQDILELKKQITEKNYEITNKN